MKVISQHALNGLSQNCGWSLSYKGFIVKTEVRASVAKDNRSGNWNISWVWAHPPVCHSHHCLANGALDGNKVFTFPFGSGRWIIPAIDIISANKESCLGLAVRAFKVMKVAGAWDHPCVPDPVSRGWNDWCTPTSPVLMNGLILLALQLASAQGPSSQNLTDNA